MANRTFTQFQYSLEKGVVNLFVQVAIGAAGAPTINVANSKGVTSITRNSAGKYTLVLQDKYIRTMMLNGNFVFAGVPACDSVSIFTDSAASAGLVIQCAAGGVATDPANGEVLMLQIVLSNSTAN